jgi:hypothetical protein
MTTDTTPRHLVETILKWLRRGLTLSMDTMAFMEATYSEPPERILATLEATPDVAEGDALVELIFFPDQALQTAIEPLLEAEALDPQGARQVAQDLVTQMPRVNVYLPHNVRPYAIRLRGATAQALVARLRVTKALIPEIGQAIRDHVNADDRLRVRVTVRNSNWQPAQNGVAVLVSLFKNIDSKQAAFWPFLDFVLVCLEEIGASGNAFRKLLARKGHLEHQLHRALRYERQRAQHNMETLLLQGERAPFCDVGQLQQQLHMVTTVLQWLPENTTMHSPVG